MGRFPRLFLAAILVAPTLLAGAGQSNREMKERAKAEREQMMARPLSASMRAKAADVKPLLINAMRRYGYDLLADSQYRMIFEGLAPRGKAVASAAGSGGDVGSARCEAKFVITELRGETILRASALMVMEDRFGRQHSTSMDQHPSVKAQILAAMDDVKTKLESEPTAPVQ